MGLLTRLHHILQRLFSSFVSSSSFFFKLFFEYFCRRQALKRSFSTNKIPRETWADIIEFLPSKQLHVHCETCSLLHALITRRMAHFWWTEQECIKHGILRMNRNKMFTYEMDFMHRIGRYAYHRAGTFVIEDVNVYGRASGDGIISYAEYIVPENDMTTNYRHCDIIPRNPQSCFKKVLNWLVYFAFGLQLWYPARQCRRVVHRLLLSNTKLRLDQRMMIRRFWGPAMWCYDGNATLIVKFKIARNNTMKAQWESDSISQTFLTPSLTTITIQDRQIFMDIQDIHWFEVLRSAKNCQPILQMVNEVLVNGCRRYRRHKDLWCDLRPDLQFHQRTGFNRPVNVYLNMDPAGTGHISYIMHPFDTWIPHRTFGRPRLSIEGGQLVIRQRRHINYVGDKDEYQIYYHERRLTARNHQGLLQPLTLISWFIQEDDRERNYPIIIRCKINN